jgi:hypothetical protein
MGFGYIHPGDTKPQAGYTSPTNPTSPFTPLTSAAPGLLLAKGVSALEEPSAESLMNGSSPATSVAARGEPRRGAHPAR